MNILHLELIFSKIHVPVFFFNEIEKCYRTMIEIDIQGAVMGMEVVLNGQGEVNVQRTKTTC